MQFIAKDNLKKYLKFLLKYPHVHILSDDIYEHILYNSEKFYNIINVNSSLKERTFIVNGVSKVFSMTGWRIGYGAGDRNFIKVNSKIAVTKYNQSLFYQSNGAKHALEKIKIFN